MALNNALSNAATSLLNGAFGSAAGLVTGTNPLGQVNIGPLLNTSIPGVPLVSTRDYFLFQLQSWVSNFPLQSQWIAVIESYPAALNTRILQGLERVGGSRNSFDINLAKTILTSYPFQRVSGCLFCNGCTLPPESYNVKNITLENNRGFIPGIASGDRQPYAGQPLQLSFFETSTSFVDFILRPWVILASHYGFVAREGDTPRSKSPYNVKSNIILLYFTRTLENVSMVPRKIFKFYNCAPTGVPNQEYSYEEPSTVKAYTVPFTYTNYTVENNLYIPLPNLIKAAQ